MTCDNCELTIPIGNAIHGVAISSSTCIADGDVADFDPQFEAYLCTECLVKIATSLRGVLRQELGL